MELPTKARLERTVDLDLSGSGTTHNIWLVIPFTDGNSVSAIAFLTDGRYKQANELEIGEAVYLTGDKVGLVTGVEEKLHTPQPQQGIIIIYRYDKISLFYFAHNRIGWQLLIRSFAIDI